MWNIVFSEGPCWSRRWPRGRDLAGRALDSHAVGRVALMAVAPFLLYRSPSRVARVRHPDPAGDGGGDGVAPRERAGRVPPVPRPLSGPRATRGWTGLCHGRATPDLAGSPVRSLRLLSEVFLMRKFLAFPLFLFFVLATGCSDPTGSEGRTADRQWASTGFASTTIEMGLTEVARSVEGAGSWVGRPRWRPPSASPGPTPKGPSRSSSSSRTAPTSTSSASSPTRTPSTGTLTGGDFRDRPITFVRVEPEEK